MLLPSSFPHTLLSIPSHLLSTALQPLFPLTAHAPRGCALHPLSKTLSWWFHPLPKPCPSPAMDNGSQPLSAAEASLLSSGRHRDNYQWCGSTWKPQFNMSQFSSSLLLLYCLKTKQNKSLYHVNGRKYHIILCFYCFIGDSKIFFTLYWSILYIWACIYTNPFLLDIPYIPSFLPDLCLNLGPYHTSLSIKLLRLSCVLLLFLAC